MPVRMTEIPPQIPSGDAKISIEVADIIAEASFDAELGLEEVVPIEGVPESSDFMQVGQILRKITPLEVQMRSETAQPPNIDVEPLVRNPEIAEATQQIVVAESKIPSKVVSTEETDSELQKVEPIPLEVPIGAQTPNPLSIDNVTKEPSIQEMPLAVKVQRKPQIAEISADPNPARNLDIKHNFSQPKISTPRSAAPTPPDIAADISPESKLQTTANEQRGFGDIGAGISGKPLAQRSLPSVMPTVPPNTVRPQAAEAKIISQISTAISNTARDTVEIRLDPPELGRVIITITQTDSGLSATVTSEKAEISDLLRRHAELLSRELSKSGFNEASLEFSHRDRRQDRPTLEGDKVRFSSASHEQADVASTVEMILLAQSGSLDIRL